MSLPDEPPNRVPPSLARVERAWTALFLLAVVGLMGAFLGGDAIGTPAVFVAVLAGMCAVRYGYWHPYRLLGLLPWLLIPVAGGAVWAAVVGRWDAVPQGLAVLGFCAILMTGPRAASVAAPWWVMAALVTILVGSFVFQKALERSAAVPYVASVAFVLALAVAWRFLFRPWFEFTVEPVLWAMYHIRAAGPGANAVPLRGPCLIVANHACWLDPLFLSKVLPRPTIPMMTGRFYDAPVIRFLMRSFGTIRVPEQKGLRRNAPEIQEAVAALDRGECVVVFPEGYLRRTEERPLRRFGQGVWQILKARPNTPVFAVWIEGGWGSYCSYFNGPPTKNKKPDRRRPIGIGMSAPTVLGAATLDHNLQTRIELMNRVGAARGHLGLPELTRYELPKGDDADEDAQS